MPSEKQIQAGIVSFLRELSTIADGILKSVPDSEQLVVAFWSGAGKGVLRAADTLEKETEFFKLILGDDYETQDKAGGS